MEHKLTFKWADLKENKEKTSRWLQITFKNNLGIKYKGNVKATENNIKNAMSLNEVLITGNCEEKSYPNTFNKTIVQYFELTYQQLKDLGFELQTREETLKKQESLLIEQLKQN